MWIFFKFNDGAFRLPGGATFANQEVRLLPTKRRGSLFSATRQTPRQLFHCFRVAFPRGNAKFLHFDNRVRISDREIALAREVSRDM